MSDNDKIGTTSSDGYGADMKQIKQPAIRWLLKFYDYGALFCFLAMFFCVAVEVVSRNIIKMPTTWAEELSRFFCVWSVFLGSASAWCRGSHIAIVGLLTRLTGKAKQSMIWFVDIVSGVFLVGIWLGSLFIMYESYETTTTALEMSISFFYLGLFLGVTGMVVFHIYNILSSLENCFKGLKSTGQEQNCKG